MFSGKEKSSKDKDNKEVKLERVEKTEVDKSGNATLRDVREDRGGEDPGLNFQDKRPDHLVQVGTPIGMVGNQGSATDLQSGSSRTSSGMGSSGQSTTTTTTRQSSTSSHGSTGGAMGSQHHSSATSGMGSMGSQFQSSGSSGMSSQQQSMGSSGMGGGGGSSYQRTEVTTSSSGGPSIGGLQRTVIVPTGAHSEIHEQTDIMRHSSGSQSQSETHVISVPVTTFGTSQMESVRTGYTFTEDKALTMAAPQLAQQITSKLDMQLGGGASAEIHAGTTVDLSQMQRKDQGPEEYARYKAKVEALASKDEKDAGMRAAQYREEVERDAEMIRQILERQHIRDLEFRKEMIEHQVDRQEREIQLEAEYAMRALELERKAATEALETAKAQTNVNVRFDSAVGTTISKGSISTSTEKSSHGQVGSPVSSTTTTTTEQQRSTRI